jgi:hypothetical protein
MQSVYNKSLRNILTGASKGGARDASAGAKTQAGQALLTRPDKPVERSWNLPVNKC